MAEDTNLLYSPEKERSRRYEGPAGDVIAIAELDQRVHDAITQRDIAKRELEIIDEGLDILGR